MMIVLLVFNFVNQIALRLRKEAGVSWGNLCVHRGKLFMNLYSTVGTYMYSCMLQVKFISCQNDFNPG